MCLLASDCCISGPAFLTATQMAPALWKHRLDQARSPLGCRVTSTGTHMCVLSLAISLFTQLSWSSSFAEIPALIRSDNTTQQQADILTAYRSTFRLPVPTSGASFQLVYFRRLGQANLCLAEHTSKLDE